ncbi:MAG: hypothetical protein ACP5G1_03245 [Nanopusillaceae archaeon]
MAINNGLTLITPYKYKQVKRGLEVIGGVFGKTDEKYLDKIIKFPEKEFRGIGDEKDYRLLPIIEEPDKKFKQPVIIEDESYKPPHGKAKLYVSNKNLDKIMESLKYKDNVYIITRGSYLNSESGYTKHYMIFISEESPGNIYKILDRAKTKDVFVITGEIGELGYKLYRITNPKDETYMIPGSKEMEEKIKRAIERAKEISGGNIGSPYVLPVLIKSENSYLVGVFVSPNRYVKSELGYILPDVRLLNMSIVLPAVVKDENSSLARASISLNKYAESGSGYILPDIRSLNMSL